MGMDKNITRSEWMLIQTARENQIAVIIAKDVELRMRRPVYVTKSGARKMQISVNGVTSYREVFSVNFYHGGESITRDALIVSGTDCRFVLPFPLPEDFQQAKASWLKQGKLRTTPREDWSRFLCWTGRGHVQAVSRLRRAFRVINDGMSHLWEEVRDALDAVAQIPEPGEPSQAERLEAERLEAERLEAERLIKDKQAASLELGRNAEWLAREFGVTMEDAKRSLGWTPGRK